MKSLRIGMIGCALILQCVASWALTAVLISDLSKTPLPPNPIRVWGTVTSVSPVKIGDGTTEILVSGLFASVGDFVVLTGNWNGSVLTVTAPIDLYIGPARVQMVYIPAGSFDMGTLAIYTGPHGVDEHPQHSVYLSGYCIGRYEVTRGEYKQFKNAGGYTNSSYWSTTGWTWKLAASRTQPDYWAASQNWGGATFTQTDNYPVVGVTYYEAEAFCNWAGGRLPTEAQWERASRRWTGVYNVYPWGDVWDLERCNNWYDTLYPKYQTVPVGSYVLGASPYYCQDMVGNVGEWCKDWWDSGYYSQTPPGGWIDPQGPASSSTRAMRGGGWVYDYPNNNCTGRMAIGSPTGKWNYVGFRMAR